MKPAYVRISTDGVELTFDDGGIYHVAELENGEQQYALDYLSNVFGLTNVTEQDGNIDADVGIDQTLEDWALATDAHRRNEESNDALLYLDADSDLPADYLAGISVSHRLAAALAGLFEELNYAS